MGHNVDFGLVALFAVQCGLVALVYHAWKGVQNERNALVTAKKEVESLPAAFKLLEGKMSAVEESPKAVLRRIQEAEASLGKCDSGIDRLNNLFDTLNGRVSALQRAAKDKSAPAAKADPAPQGEDGEAYGPASPGSLSQEAEEQRPAIPPTFGKKWRVA